MTRKGILFIISGPSGVGKGTIKDVVLRKIADIKLSISATTRSPRSGETSGKDYYFVNEDTFQQLNNNDELLEWANVYDNMYGTPRQFVEENLTRGQDVILEIDMQGGMKVKHVFHDAVSIYIIPPTFAELKKRIEGRGTETEKDICKRLKNAYEELGHVNNYDYVVVNDDIKNTAKKIDCILTAEKCRLSRSNIDFYKFREG